MCVICPNYTIYKRFDPKPAKDQSFRISPIQPFKNQASPGKKHSSTVLEAALGPKVALESQSSAQFAWSNLEGSIPQLLSWSWEVQCAVYCLLPLDSSDPRKTGHPWMKRQTAESNRHQTGPSKAVSPSNPRSEKQHPWGNRQTHDTKTAAEVHCETSPCQQWHVWGENGEGPSKSVMSVTRFAVKPMFRKTWDDTQAARVTCLPQHPPFLKPAGWQSTRSICRWCWANILASPVPQMGSIQSPPVRLCASSLSDHQCWEWVGRPWGRHSYQRRRSEEFLNTNIHTKLQRDNSGLKHAKTITNPYHPTALGWCWLPGLRNLCCLLLVVPFFSHQDLTEKFGSDKSFK